MCRQVSHGFGLGLEHDRMGRIQSLIDSRYQITTRSLTISVCINVNDH
jgi:hypothetical protein